KQNQDNRQRKSWEGKFLAAWIVGMFLSILVLTPIWPELWFVTYLLMIGGSFAFQILSIVSDERSKHGSGRWSGYGIFEIFWYIAALLIFPAMLIIPGVAPLGLYVLGGMILIDWIVSLRCGKITL